MSCIDLLMPESVSVELEFGLDQGQHCHKLWQRGQIGPQPVFVNEVLSEHRHTHLFTFSFWLLQGQRWVVWQTLYGSTNLKYLHSDTLQKKFANSLVSPVWDHPWNWAWSQLQREWQLNNEEERVSKGISMSY